MPSARTIARRGFLIGSVAVAGGVAFGIYVIRRPHENPLAATLKPGEVSFNPWVRITRDTITLITPHVDLGQGAVHMQSLLLAEEMDLDPDQFETSFGPAAAAYYNTALAAESAPFPVTDMGVLAELTRASLGAVSKVAGIQGTGGSTSVTDSFDKLRRAGAVARETLKEAAARMHGVPREALSTASGAVVLPDGRRLRYQDLAEAASALEPVRDATPRDAQGWRLIGKALPRRDMVAKSTGTQVYGIDVALEGMVHAAVRLSPTRAPAVRADTSAASAMPGVERVLTIPDGFAVIAGTTWTAMQAAQAIDVDWGAPDYPAGQEAHWARLEAAFTPEQLDRVWRDDGDAALDASEPTIAEQYRAPYVAHQPLEPLNATILVMDDIVEIWTSHQLAGFAQRAVARVTGHDPEQVVLHNQYAGGSFGHRLEVDFLVQAAEIGQRIPGVPVKLTYSREEDFARDYPRQIGMARCRGHVRDGKVASLDLQIAQPSPLASQLGRIGMPMVGPDSQIVAGAWNAPYDIERFRVRGYRAEGLAPVSSWRSVGASVCGFFLEGFLDELIHASGADPLEERLRLCKWPVARGVLEEVAAMSGWGAPLAPGRGRGVALVESFGVPVAQVVEVSSGADGIRIERVWAAADAGQVVDPSNFESQVQGGIVWGLGHAINSELTYRDGIAEQTNYHAAEGMRFYQAPRIEVRWREDNHRVRGIGEPPVPPAAPALANAIFAATGLRLREMPFARFVDFA